MRKWSYAANSYHKTANYILEEAPWYIFLIEEVNFFICNLVPHISLLNIGKVWDEEDKKYFTWKEWYGSLDTCWHMLVCDRIFQWCKKRTKEIAIEYDYEKLKKNHPEDKKWFERQEKNM